jgi:hypothetical protein
MNKDELHRKVDESITSIIKNIGNVVENMKFNDTQLLEETNNLELSTSVDQIDLRLIDLLKIVNEMKVEHLRKKEYFPDRAEKISKTVSDDIKKIGSKIIILQENYNYTSMLLKEWKSSKFYKYAQSYKNN